MAKVCSVCGKGTITGNHVSHAVNHNKRTFKPNLRSVRAKVNGSNKRVLVCASCLRSGAVERA